MTTDHNTGPVYYTDPADLPVIQSAIKTLAEKNIQTLAAEIKPLANFYKAEDYHQDYLDNIRRILSHRLIPDLAKSKQP